MDPQVALEQSGSTRTVRVRRACRTFPTESGLSVSGGSSRLIDLNSVNWAVRGCLAGVQRPACPSGLHSTHYSKLSLNRKWNIWIRR